jgi:CheY-like chemotaxis protein
MATILAIDDDPVTREKLRETLEKLGHEVRLALSVDTAIRLSTYRVPVHLVVFATRADGGPGAGADAALRLRRAYPGVPLLLVGEGGAALPRLAAEAGAAGFVRAPHRDPAVLAGEVARALGRVDGRSPPTTAPAGGRAPGGGPVVLLADDNDILRSAMLRVLLGAGVEAFAADSGEDALRAADRLGRVDLLVTDLRMPGMSGAELADRLAEARPALKILFMSGYPVDDAELSGARPGRAAVLQKPFRYGTLLEQVQRLLAA